MLGRTNTSGGGGGLNFKVVGGTTQPTNPAENTIWVNTSVAISGYVFAATAPSAPVEGMVWISTGNSSLVAFNALKKNGITVYPLSAKQYVSGAWVGKPAKCYQNAAWVDMHNYLYSYGLVNTALTGGITGYGYTTDSDTQIFKPVFNSDHIYMPSVGGLTAVGSMDKVDLTNAKTLYADVELTVNKWGFWLLADTDKNLSTRPHVTTVNTKGRKTLKLDVSSLTGSFYISVASTDGGVSKVYEMWLE